MGAWSPFPKHEPRRSPEKLALSLEASGFHKLPIKLLMMLRPQPPGRYCGVVLGGSAGILLWKNLITPPDPRGPANMAMSVIIIILIIDGFSDT